MDANNEMLNYIHQNAEMGQNTITKLIDIVEDGEFKSALQSQFNEYKQIFDETEKIVNKYGKTTKDINTLQKMEAYMMISMKTMNDKSPDHISEMLMQGSIMGIIQIIRRLKKYKNEVDSDVYNLGEKLLKTEQNNIEQLKKFIG